MTTDPTYSPGYHQVWWPQWHYQDGCPAGGALAFWAPWLDHGQALEQR
jgi:hypothetical protein